MVPRDPTLQSAYRTSKLARPRLKVHGVWIFGMCLRIGVIDETVAHGSSMVVELLSLALDDAMRLCQARGHPPPHTVVVVGTTR